jgi:hypothetical protein
VYFSDDGARMTVLHINPDSASLEFHMKVAGPKFPPIGEFINMLAIDLYGYPGDALVDRLRQKAEMRAAGRYACTSSTRGSLAYSPARPSTRRDSAQRQIRTFAHRRASL